MFSQFFANPYQFNPSYVASHGYTEANVFYRRQWLGIDNTPTVGSLNIQAPFGRNVSLGFNAYSDKSALLTNTSALVTFGYRVRFDYQHHFSFGISAGAGFNSFDLSAIEETNDPALAGIMQNNTYLNGQFGFNYQWKNLNVGIAFPKLFDSKPNSATAFNEIDFDKFDQRFASISYSINLGEVRVAPTVLYRSLGANQDQFEGMLIARYKNIFWIGSSYRTDYGVTGFIGIDIKGLLRLGYSYEKATGDIGAVIDGTHEVFLGARLGKRDREQEWIVQKQEKDSLNMTLHKNEVEPQIAETHDTEPILEPEKVEAPAVLEKTKPVEVEEDTTPVVAEVTETVEITNEPDQEPEQQSLMEPVKEEQKTNDITVEEKSEAFKKPLEHGYYLVVGVYKVAENATRVINSLKSKGHNASALYHPEKDYYYVYVFKSLDKHETIRELQIIKRKNQFFAAWIFSVE